ncbi:MAG: sigma-70 family RNA polymerase sigma factor [Polyangiaceae bacterium]
MEVVGGLWDDAGKVAAPDVCAIAAELLGRLPERERAVMRLRFWAGADAEEIAAELGVSVGTVERDAALAMGRMRREMDEGRWRPRVGR